MKRSGSGPPEARSALQVGDEEVAVGQDVDDLLEDLIARIPAHTPEWTNPRLGDPGRTLLELFAWLGDSLLYRVNLIPERQRLVFLKRQPGAKSLPRTASR